MLVFQQNYGIIYYIRRIISMRMVDIIEKKRNGFTLTKEEIDFFINGYVNNIIPDYQVSALLMAIYFQKMT